MSGYRYRVITAGELRPDDLFEVDGERYFAADVIVIAGGAVVQVTGRDGTVTAWDAGDEVTVPA